jgi:ubiquinol-cytochrome c reductase iron-sulfur subunit
VSRQGTEAAQPDAIVAAERRAERRAALAFLACAAAAGALAVVYWRGGNPRVEGILLGLALGGLGVGFVTMGQRLLPQGPVEQERHELSATEVEEDELEEEFERAASVGRRRLLMSALAAAVAGLGAAILFPIRSLGPKEGGTLSRTPWRPGMRLVTDDGRPVTVAAVPANGIVTVFPEGHAGSADGQAVLVRVDPGVLAPKKGREDWSPQGLLAYSKVCTHAGCPVGLYQAETHQLLCPCHQSAFDILDEAKPVFGPAARPLPQLPLSVDAEGVLRAQGDFSEPIGPAWWNRR